MLWYYSLTQIYDKSHVIGGLTQAWSLCTEITFYVFLPAFAAAMARATRRQRTAEQRLRAQFVVLAGLYAVSLAFRWWITSRWFGPHGAGFVVGPFHVSWGCANSWLPATLDYFALGMLLAVLQAWGVSAAPRWRQRLEALGAHAWVSWSLALVAFWVVSKHAGLPIDLSTYSRESLFARQFLYGAFGFFALIPAVFGPQDRGLGRWVLRTRAMVWVGTVSYGVYLSHELWIKEFHQWTGIQALKGGFLGMLAFVALLSVAMASTSYVLVERPILRRVRRPAPPALPPGPAADASDAPAPEPPRPEAVTVP
jgi:peptidoglycan/LPS O-acetylase OafA/YrhL